VASKSCTACRLHLTCKHVCMPGDGKQRKPYAMFVGEAPGATEDDAGRPFVGASGDRLRGLIRRLGIEKDCIITNAVRCRPPENRKPRYDEIQTCREHLIAEVRRVKPEVIVLLGATAIQSVMELKSVRVGDYRGRKNWSWEGARVIATYHPAATLRPGGEQYLQWLIEDLNRLAKEEWTPRESVTWREVKGAQVCQYLRTGKDPVAIDIETTCLSPFADDARILSVAWSTRNDHAYVTRDVEAFLDAFYSIMYERVWLGHNLKFDLMWLTRGFTKGEREEWMLEDTYVLAHLLDENAPSKGLKTLAGMYTGYGPYAEGVMEAREHEQMAALEPDMLMRYNAYDAAATRKVWKVLRPRLQKEGLERLYREQMDLLPVVMEMEQAGVTVDQCRRIEMLTQYQDKTSEVSSRLSELGLSNPGSHTQLAQILHMEGRLPVIAKTKAGKPKVDIATLHELQRIMDDPIFRLINKERLAAVIELVLEYRSLTKTTSTYLIPFSDPVIHASFNQCGTVTGRFSSSNPNMQNIPREGKHPVKDIFKASAGRLFVGADYSQIELRIGAQITRDSAMLDVFRKGLDLHTETARQILGHEPSKEERAHAKTVNFGIFYGMGARRLAEQTGRDKGWAASYIRSWYATYPGVKAWQQEQEQRLLKDGFLVSIFDRRRRFGLRVRSNRKEEYLAALREACNFPIQSAAGDLTSMAMIVLRASLPREAQIVLNIHDQIIVECREKDWEKVAVRMWNVMVDADALVSRFGFDVEFLIPTPVEVKVGPTWGGMEEVELS